MTCEADEQDLLGVVAEQERVEAAGHTGLALAPGHKRSFGENSQSSTNAHCWAEDWQVKLDMEN